MQTILQLNTKSATMKSSQMGLNLIKWVSDDCLCLSARNETLGLCLHGTQGNLVLLKSLHLLLHVEDLWLVAAWMLLRLPLSWVWPLCVTTRSGRQVSVKTRARGRRGRT